jgi:hypothetical protein
VKRVRHLASALAAFAMLTVVGSAVAAHTTTLHQASAVARSVTATRPTHANSGITMRRDTRAVNITRTRPARSIVLTSYKPPGGGTNYQYFNTYTFGWECAGVAGILIEDGVIVNWICESTGSSWQLWVLYP